MTLPSPGFLLAAFFQACRRFPATMLATLCGVVALLIILEERNSSAEDLLLRIWMVCQLGLPLLTGLAVRTDSRKQPAGQQLLAQGIGVVALIAYAWFLQRQPDDEFESVQLPRYLLLLGAAHLFVSVAPYLNQRSVADFWEYNRRLFASFVVGATFTLILYAGLALAVLAVDRLFNLNLSHLIYARLFIVLAGIFNTTYFLYHFPEKYEFETEDASYNAVFRNLCKYILIPIVGLYFLILYAYAAKIIGSWSLPRGWVGSLVMGFSVVGIFTYLLNYYLPQFDNSKMVHLYRKAFWWVLLPLTGLLFAAVGKRISDYGFTEPRYLLALTGVWLAGNCIYFLISKSDNIKFIPISLGLAAILAAVGPWSAFSVARRSQTAILENVLERNGRWQNGQLQQNTAPMLQAEISQVRSALDFLDRRGVLEEAAWLPMPVDSFKEEAYTNTGRVMAWLGIPDALQEESSRYFTVAGAAQEATDIRGFSQYFPLHLQENQSVATKNGYYFARSEDGRRILWQEIKDQKTSTVESFDMQPILRDWRNKTPGNYLDLTGNEAAFDLVGAKGTLRIRVTGMQIKEEKDDLQFTYLEGHLFLKMK